MNNLDKTYGENFYEFVDREATSSAKVVVPYLIKKYGPSAVVDVGCGRGAWLSVLIENGITDYLGIDGPHVSRDKLFPNIDSEKFVCYDFEKDGIPDVMGRFDMALCLEVAEHLSAVPAWNLIGWLCTHADVIVFSAAIPAQGGVGHINEQWQSYWAMMFARRNKYPCSWIRDDLWNHNEVQPYYRQNILVYSAIKGLMRGPLDVVHPDLWRYKLNIK